METIFQLLIIIAIIAVVLSIIIALIVIGAILFLSGSDSDNVDIPL